MRYNADTDRARLLDDLAAESRAVISKLNPPAPRDIVWSSLEGRWVRQSAAKIEENQLVTN